MKQLTKTAAGLAGVIAISAFMSCASTDITSTWKDPSYQGRLHRVMVIGVFNKPQDRRICEDEFVKQFREHGTDAVPSYTVLPDQKKWPSELIQQKMKQVGADSVLIASLVDKKTVTNYSPGTPYYGSPYFGGGWYDYYSWNAGLAYSPGYLTQEQYAVMQTNVYDAGSGKLVWAASSETEMSSNGNYLKSFADAVSKNMASHKLLAKS